MTKELSKQLCELCGMKPKIRYFLNFLDVEYESTKENIIAHAEAFRSDCLKIKRVIRDYPDFGKPENFVRLYQLINKQTTNEVLSRIVGQLQVEVGWHTDELKQSIREAEWVYG